MSASSQYYSPPQAVYSFIKATSVDHVAQAKFTYAIFKMSEELSKLKDIIRVNIRNVKEVADTLVYVRERLLATEEVVAELISRVEEVESRRGPTTSDGVRMFGVGANQSESNARGAPDLDIDKAELVQIIVQHPKWLRPFSVQAELEKHELEVETLRLRRSSSGYMRVVRLSNGTEWAYLEEMSFERFSHLTLLRQVFDLSSARSEWASAWVEDPIKLQSLQRGARWEIVGKGKLITEI
ncbi:hypothetical protein KBY58_00340 [Cyanobium sp. HWJ4-Hawea]|uniref:hypothetical protein n=1 Tax=Cyanobium sp. HWJ4-Hawea TaxID=2823713 RepID=UPI0020CCB3B9|nr:hypothetical protein [Cyanobium sp. HWJ4-Hawea]MCP9807884.1 hypothetical protein [Cyanobium sp. HWJ4-Hawea]